VHKLLATRQAGIFAWPAMKITYLQGLAMKITYLQGLAREITYLQGLAKKITYLQGLAREITYQYIFVRQLSGNLQDRHTCIHRRNSCRHNDNCGCQSHIRSHLNRRK
jgi:hypothetical protein